MNTTYPKKGCYTPSLAEHERMAELVARDIRRGCGLDNIRAALVAADWRHIEGYEDIFIGWIIREGERLASPQPREEAEKRAGEEAERRANEESERRLRELREAIRRAKEEAEISNRQAAERRAIEAEHRARAEAERQVREAESRARAEAERRAREVENRARAEAEQRRAREESEKRAREAEAKAKLEAKLKDAHDASTIILAAGTFQGGTIESGMAEYLKGRLVKLPDADLRAVRRCLSGLMPTKDGKKNIERVYAEYLGISDVMLSHIQEIYIHYPESKFPEVAELFHKYDVPLSVRPKLPPGPNTKAAKGEGPDQGGLGGRLKVLMPNDRGVATAINAMLDVEGVSVGEEYETNNVKVVMTLLLIFNYKQKKPLGPEWESEESKRKMYEKHGLLNLLEQ